VNHRTGDVNHGIGGREPPQRGPGKCEPDLNRGMGGSEPRDVNHATAGREPCNREPDVNHLSEDHKRVNRT